MPINPYYNSPQPWTDPSMGQYTNYQAPQTQAPQWMPQYLQGATQQPTSNPFGGMLGGAAQGAAIGSIVPGIGTLAGAGIGAGLSLLTGLFGGIASGKTKNQNKKEYKAAQTAYQQQAAKLFPELSAGSFQYSNPALSNAIQSGLAYRLQNMFSDWGMPQGRTQGADTLNNIFAGLMNNPWDPTKVANQAYAQGLGGQQTGYQNTWGGQSNQQA